MADGSGLVQPDPHQNTKITAENALTLTDAESGQGRSGGVEPSRDEREIGGHKTIKRSQRLMSLPEAQTMGKTVGDTKRQLMSLSRAQTMGKTVGGKQK